VILPVAAAIQVKVGDHVAGGSSVLAMAPVAASATLKSAEAR
jgi:hypothetical protein